MHNSDVKAAYFCAEFGIDGLPLNGGLGILAGDYIKSCSDLHLPVVGVGLFYKKGIFHQRIDNSGWQHEYFEPFFPTGRLSESSQKFEVPLKNGGIFVNSFKFPVYSSIPGDDYHIDIRLINDKEHLDGLYPGGDQRIKKLIHELILGIGGVGILEKLGYNGVTIYHANEGHAALMSSALKEKYVGYDEARKHMVFTTHTPVPAGIDIYSKEESEAVIPENILTELRGLTNRQDLHMMILAMASSFNSFGVSLLHKQVSKQQFCDFPGMANLGYVDNGIHIPTWVSPEYEGIYDKVTNAEWRKHPKLLEEKISDISNDEIIGAHKISENRLAGFLRDNPRVIGNSVYDPNKLTIGFARRFATYKQADLFLDYLDIMRKVGKDVNFIIAGKSHPSDTAGKEIIRKLIKYAKGMEKDIPIWFIEDYDMVIARYLVQGVDLWLNNPERLREAAGTSGMKAAANFVPQFSIIDGWWMPQDAPSGYHLPKGLVEGVTGWGIGRMPTEADFLLLEDNSSAREARARDRIVDGKDLVDKLNELIIPTFKKPSDWVKVMRGSAQHNVPWFNTHRMAIEYFKEYGLEEELSKLNLTL